METFDTLINNKNSLLKLYIWLLPVAILLNILILLGRDYALCKMKFFFDLKYISEIKFLVWLGFFGIIINLIGGLAVTFIPCANKKNINYICKINYNNKLYFDNFRTFFKNLWKKDEKEIINILRTLIIIAKVYIFFC